METYLLEKTAGSMLHCMCAARRARDKEAEDLEHHMAAIQIQEMFRKRRAAKEASNATRLPRPFVQQVFRGHRNSRTMVISE